MAGVAVGHIVGYALAHPDVATREAALGGHAYLPTVATAVIPLGVLTALWWAVRTARLLGLAGQIDWRRLAAAQVVVFLCQEMGERSVGGEGVSAAVSERGVWFGLLAQIVVAFLVTRGIDAVRRVIRAVTAGRPITSRLPRHCIVLPAAPVASVAPATVAVGLRAPPALGSAR